MCDRLDALVLAAVQAGDENADYDEARARLAESLEEPFVFSGHGLSDDEIGLRKAVGVL